MCVCSCVEERGWGRHRCSEGFFRSESCLLLFHYFFSSSSSFLAAGTHFSECQFKYCGSLYVFYTNCSAQLNTVSVSFTQVNTLAVLYTKSITQLYTIPVSCTKNSTQLYTIHTSCTKCSTQLKIAILYLSLTPNVFDIHPEITRPLHRFQRTYSRLKELAINSKHVFQRVKESKGKTQSKMLCSKSLLIEIYLKEEATSLYCSIFLSGDSLL